MSQLGKANETIMGLPRSGGGSTLTTHHHTNSSSSVEANNNNNNNEEKITSIDTLSKRGTKRLWHEEEVSPDTQHSAEEPPQKLLCTSPPHALCAEDVPQHAPHQPAAVMPTSTSSSSVASSASEHPNMTTTNLSSTSKSCDGDDEEDMGDDSDMEDIEEDVEDRDLLDEEDKDSGFIDSNSVDNSSDDDMDVRLSTSTSSSTGGVTTSSSETHSNSREVSIAGGNASTDEVCNSKLVSLQNCSNLSQSHLVLLPSCSSAFSSVIPSSTPTEENSKCFLELRDSKSSLVPSTSNNSDNDSTESCCSSSDIVSTSLSTSIALSIDILNSPSNSSLLQSASASCSSSPNCDDRIQVNNSLPSFSSYTSHYISPVSQELCSLPSLSPSPTPSAETVVTSAYPSSLSTPTYDPHMYSIAPPSPYSADFRGCLTPIPSGPIAGTPSVPAVTSASGAWSCNFYDNNPPTNKYMEIQMSKPGGAVPVIGAVAGVSGVGLSASPEAGLVTPPTSNQAIQCDANGKSYMELGSSSPFTQTYSSIDCGNYTTPPSNFSNNVFSSQGYGNNNNSYGPQQPVAQQSASLSSGSQYYRPNYPQYSSYPNGENYPGNYDSDMCYTAGPSGYSHGPAGSPYHNTGRKQLLPTRCSSPFCDPSKSPSTSGGRVACYQQQRLSVLNLSMCKLNRFSRYPDPSLHKSVLICNTLRLIERELESEGTSMNALLSQQHMMQTLPPPPSHCPPPPPLTPPPAPQSNGVMSEGPLPPMQPPMLGGCTPGPILPPPIVPPYNGSSLQYSPHYGSSDGSYEDLRLYSSGHHEDASDADGLQGLPSTSAIVGGPVCLPPSPMPPFGASPSNTLNSNIVICTSSNSNIPTTSNNIFTGSINNNSNSNVAINNSSCNSSSSSNSSNNVSNNSNSSSNNSNSISNNVSDDRSDGSIDWCSVLSLPSQSELDSLNNSEFCEWNNDNSTLQDMDYTTSSTVAITSSNNTASSSGTSNSTLMFVSGRTVAPCGEETVAGSSSSSTSQQWKLPSLSADDILKTFPDSSRRALESSDELDTLINVLVES